MGNLANQVPQGVKDTETLWIALPDDIVWISFMLSQIYFIDYGGDPSTTKEKKARRRMVAPPVAVDTKL